MRGFLFASFGTSHAAARAQQIDAVATYLAQELPGFTPKQAFTSNLVRQIWRARGEEIPDVAAALQAFAAAGVTEVLIQPGHLLPGEEYDKLCAQAERCRALFARLSIGEPLLARTADLHRVAEILMRRYPAGPDRAVVLLGHGTPQYANAVYAALDYRFKEQGRADIFVGTVEAYPDLDTVLRLVARGPYQSVLLAPLMQVAGDHAVNDLAGDAPASWASRFQAAGYQVTPKLQGLGELPEIQALYLAHARAALED